MSIFENIIEEIYKEEVHTLEDYLDNATSQESEFATLFKDCKEEFYKSFILTEKFITMFTSFGIYDEDDAKDILKTSTYTSSDAKDTFLEYFKTQRDYITFMFVCHYFGHTEMTKFSVVTTNSLSKAYITKCCKVIPLECEVNDIIIDNSEYHQ